MTNLLLVQLAALQAHMQAVSAAIEQELGPAEQKEVGSCPKCGASPEQVADASTLDGTRKSRCQSCGEVWER